MGRRGATGRGNPVTCADARKPRPGRRRRPGRPGKRTSSRQPAPLEVGAEVGTAARAPALPDAACRQMPTRPFGTDRRPHRGGVRRLHRSRPHTAAAQRGPARHAGRRRRARRGEVPPSPAPAEEARPPLHGRRRRPLPDHVEAEHVYRGPAGTWLITDAVEQALPLPEGPYDVPLAIRDARFNDSGQLVYVMGDFGNRTTLPHHAAGQRPGLPVLRDRRSQVPAAHAELLQPAHPAAAPGRRRGDRTDRLRRRPAAEAVRHRRRAPLPR